MSQSGVAHTPAITKRTGVSRSGVVATSSGPPALLSHTILAGTTNAVGPTTAINTTGAMIIIAAIGWYTPSNTAPTIVDSASNVWSHVDETGFQMGVRLFYCVNPITSASHTFTGAAVGVNPSPSIAIEVFSVIKGAVDITSGKNSGAPISQNCGAGGTPAVNNELLITGMSCLTTPAGVDSGFTVSDSVADGSVNVGLSLAYLIQTTAMAENPTWTQSASTNSMATLLVSFRPS